LKEGRIKINKGLYEGGGRKCVLQKIQWPLHEIMNENSKSYLNITYFGEKVHISNIL
jgi:hypothetical protein